MAEPRSIREYLTPTRLFWITFAGALIVFCQLQFWKLPSAKDRANWDYFAQVISRGGVPYREVVNIKTPLSAYIGAAAIVATRPFGLSPVMATRFASVGLAALTVAFTFLVANLIAGLIGRLSPRINVRQVEVVMSVVLLIAVFVVSVRSVFSFSVGRKDLVTQWADAAEIVSLLQPGDEIWVHGQTEMLVVSGLTNSHKYTSLDHGKDNYLDQVEPGGFQEWFEKLKSDRPRVVVFTRSKIVDRRAEFLDWLNRDYDRRNGKLFSYYVRKDQ